MTALQDDGLIPPAQAVRSILVHHSVGSYYSLSICCPYVGIGQFFKSKFT